MTYLQTLEFQRREREAKESAQPVVVDPEEVAKATESLVKAAITWRRGIHSNADTRMDLIRKVDAYLRATGKD